MTAPTKYPGAFGMLEMEVAAEIIIAKIKASEEKPFRTVGLDDFRGNKQAETGFLHLLAGGWLCKGMYNGRFFPLPAFFDKLNEPYD